MPSLRHQALGRLLPLLRRNHPVEDLEGMRTALTAENRAARDRRPRGVRRGRHEQVDHDLGFPVVTLWPEDGERPRRSLVYLHGGAYVHPTDPRHWLFATRLADALDAEAVVPLYPLAPEWTVADSHDALARLVEEVAARSPEGVVLAGDSAGGGLALALALTLRDRGGVQPERLVLLAPWVDLTGRTPGLREAAADDPWLSYPHLAVYAAFWAGGDDPEALADPRVSPGLGDLRGLPPAQVLCGTRDLLRPGCDALVERAGEVGWPVEYVVEPGLVHVYPLLPVPEARRAFDQVVAFCRGG